GRVQARAVAAGSQDTNTHFHCNTLLNHACAVCSGCRAASFLSLRLRYPPVFVNGFPAFAPVFLCKALRGTFVRASNYPPPSSTRYAGSPPRYIFSKKVLTKPATAAIIIKR